MQVPAAARGVAVLAAEDARFGRVAVEVVAPERAAGRATTAFEGAALPGDGRLELATGGPRRRPLGVMPHEPVYFSIGAHRGINARFQISFKFRPLGPADERVDRPGFWANLYGGYTQTSLWDLEGESKPFFDTSYRPSVFYAQHDAGVALAGGRVGWAAGVEHESNGQGGAASRSLNVVTFRPTWTREFGGDWRVGVSPRFYAYVEKEENPDLSEFRGYGDYHVWIERENHGQLSATFRLGTSGKGSVLVDVAYPIERLFELVSDTPWAHGDLHLQYFSGYAETLRSYDQRLPWQLRIGFMIVR